MLCGDSAIDASVGSATANASLPAIDPSLAVTVAAPGEFAVARRVELMVRTLVGVLDHVTALERSWVVPSANVPVALSRREWWGVKEGFRGVTAIETNAGSATASLSLPVIDPSLAVTVAAPGE